MKKLSFYGIITVISVIVRQFILPNPFECFGESAALYNWIAEPILHAFAYVLVGLVYCKGSLPAWGAFLYLIVYSVLVGVLWIFGIFSFAWWWILIVIILLIGVIVGTAFLVDKMSGGYDYD